MALRKSKSDLIKVTLNLEEEDWEFMKLTFPKTGAGAQVRKIVNAFCEKIRKQTKPSEEELEGVELV